MEIFRRVFTSAECVVSRALVLVQFSEVGAAGALRRLAGEEAAA